MRYALIFPLSLIKHLVTAVIVLKGLGVLLFIFGISLGAKQGVTACLKLTFFFPWSNIGIVKE
ncbi:hypothetical protein ACB094_05G066500 [Castanea mollissima]